MFPAPNYARTFLYGILFLSLRMSTGATAILYLLSQGFTEREIALLKSVHMLFFLLCDIPLGYLADKANKKLTIIVAIFLAGLWLAATDLALSKSILYLAEACNAVSLALFNGAFQAMLINQFQAETAGKLRPLLGKFTQYNLYGLIVAVGLAAFVPFAHVWMLWLGTGVLMFALGSWGIFYLAPESIGKLNKPKKSLPISMIYKDFICDFRNIFHIIKKKQLFTTILIYICINLLFQILINYNQIIIKNFLEINSSLAFTICFLLLLFSQSLAGKLASKHSSTGIYLPILLLSLPLVLIAFFANHFLPFVFPLLWAVYLLQGQGQIILEAEMQQAMSQHYRASFSSLYSSVIKIFGFLSLIGISYLYQSFLIVIYFCLALSSIALLL